MNILVTIDDNYIDVCTKMLFSLRAHNDNLIIHVIYDDNLTAKSIEHLKEQIKIYNIGELKLHHIDADSLNLKVVKSEYITKTCFFRLYAPFMIKDVDRLLYLDPDIVCQGSMEEFYNTDLGDNILAGCRNMLRDNVQFLYKKNCNRLNLPFGTPYINSGVLLIDMQKYRDFLTFERLNQFLQEYKEILTFQDQDTINKLFLGKIKIMDNKFNYQVNSVDWWNLSLDNTIIHYSESAKPWKDNYNDLYRGTPYYLLLHTMKKDEELKNLIIKHAAVNASTLHNQIINDNLNHFI